MRVECLLVVELRGGLDPKDPLAGEEDLDDDRDHVEPDQVTEHNARAASYPFHLAPPLSLPAYVAAARVGAARHVSRMLATSIQPHYTNAATKQIAKS